MNKTVFTKFISIAVLAAGSFIIAACSPNQSPLKPQSVALNASETLGKSLFFDARLSSPAGQSCASCHSPAHGFSHPKREQATAEGAVKGLFGNRNVPTISYIGFTPDLHKITEDGETLYIGGFFLDGREKTLQDQAIQPILNPLEMGVKDEASLVKKIKAAGYEPEFKKVYGPDSLDNTRLAIQNITNAIASYQRSKELSPFNSKYDAYLAGKTQLTKKEQLGLQLFEAEDKGNCAACHPSKIDKASGFPPLFTDYSYDNLGLPANRKNPFFNNPTQYNPLSSGYKDQGMGQVIEGENGKFKVPTLRNIALTAPYMHNGIFNTLEEAVSFYNTRDTDAKWGQAEIEKNVNKHELGDLKLTDSEIDAIVSFLKTLSDGYQIPAIN
ncbi:MAG: c-type cytochrome [Gammaproteobacteria bacterium]|nr:c-type cytochrome [Gammaproteobacteria bacterium]